MSGQEVVFVLVAVATGAAAVATVTSRNLVHAALFLAASLAGIAGVFLILHADFVAMVQLLVYVGAIAVLFLFGLMLTRAPIGREALDSRNRGLAVVASVALFGVLVALVVEAFGSTPATDPVGSSITVVGTAIFARWVLPFELASMLLLGALVGAIVLSRRSSGESGHEEPVERIELGEAPPGASAPPDRAMVGPRGGDA